MHQGRVPEFLRHAIFAVASRYVPRTHQSVPNLSEEYAVRSRGAIDTDEPCIDGLQAAILLVIAFTGAGKGAKAYMLLSTNYLDFYNKVTLTSQAIAIGMTIALELHCEVDQQTRSFADREMRRRLFWICYLLDRFMACGSKRPSLISDQIIKLRLPSWLPRPLSDLIQGEFFNPGSNLQQGSSGMLIDITRILGLTNMYLAAGGVRGDSHFPWHPLSNLSKIRQNLDTWASGTEDICSSLDKLFGQADSTTLVLSKLIYHLIHCLIYRPFLPIHLAEVVGNEQNESWQINATNLCFLHANAIAELIEFGKQAKTVEWPAFVGFCIYTAGTVHIHGTHYRILSETNIFGSSSQFLSREMHHLGEICYVWANVHHNRDSLRSLYNAHTELVQTLAGNIRNKSSFHLEDFFERYIGIGGLRENAFHIDAANISLCHTMADFTAGVYPTHSLYGPETGQELLQHSLKRKNTTTSSQEKLEKKTSCPSYHYRPISSQLGPTEQPFSALLTKPEILSSNEQTHDQNTELKETRRMEITLPLYPSGHSLGSEVDIRNGEHGVTDNDRGIYDPMFGSLPTNTLSSPAAAVPSVGNSNNDRETTTAQENEDDPFLTFLEQIAEHEQQSHDIDSFLTGASNWTQS